MRSAAQISIGAQHHDGGAHLDEGQRRCDPHEATHARLVGGNPDDALLLILADALDDLERIRIATENRLRSLIAVPLNDDDSAKNLGGTREARTMQHVAETLADLERRAILDLERAMRAHSLGPWVKRTVGVGEKQGARLLAAIGDPAARAMPSQLWQYCGHGAPSKLHKGVKTFWNPTAKMRLHLVAESCMKHRTSPYRAVYDEAREAAKGNLHTAVCMNQIPPVAGKPNGSNGCGTRANPELGAIGSPWRDGHKHNHALRMVGKAILKDLWLEARATSATRASLVTPPMAAPPVSSTSEGAA